MDVFTVKSQFFLQTEILILTLTNLYNLRQSHHNIFVTAVALKSSSCSEVENNKYVEGVMPHNTLKEIGGVHYDLAAVFFSAFTTERAMRNLACFLIFFHLLEGKNVHFIYNYGNWTFPLVTCGLLSDVYSFYT